LVLNSHSLAASAPITSYTFYFEGTELMFFSSIQPHLYLSLIGAQTLELQGQVAFDLTFFPSITFFLSLGFEDPT